MQRRAMELTAGWDLELEGKLEPKAADRYDEIAVPASCSPAASTSTRVGRAADRLVYSLAWARRVDWPDVAHLPSMERPEEFTSLMADWLANPGWSV